VQQAAEELGVTVDAVRSRIRRKTLTSEKGEDGRVFVWLSDDRSSLGYDEPQGQVEAYRELVEELRDRVRSLEEANSENRRIIAGLVQRVPELEAASPGDPTEQPEAAETVQEGPEGTEPRSGTPGPQTSPQRRSLWRRMFGGG
jgi:phage repressor protein C with HTH and peptisase S24 domain